MIASSSGDGFERVPRTVKRFYFGGVYRIVKYSRFGLADALVQPVALEDFAFRDGAIQLRVFPVPYGVRVEILNRLQETLTLEGEKCAMIDSESHVHQAELRPSNSLFPAHEPATQRLAMPPGTVLAVDLDVVMPVHRHEINAQTRTQEDRGSWFVPDAPLPVFASGYFLEEGRSEDVDRIRKWAMGRQFAVSLHLTSARGEFGYKLFIEPYRLAIGPEDGTEDWKSPKPSPFPIGK